MIHRTLAHPLRIVSIYLRSLCSHNSSNNIGQSHEIFVQKLRPSFEYPYDSYVGDFSVKVGQFVKMGDVLATVETDKVSLEVVAERSGFVNAVYTKAEETLAPGDPICAISDSELLPSSSLDKSSDEWIKEYTSLVLLLHGAVQRVSLIDLRLFDALCQTFPANVGIPQSHVIWNYAQACYLKAQYAAAQKLLSQLSSQAQLVAEIGATRLHTFLGNINYAMNKHTAAKLHFLDALQSATSDTCLAHYGLAVTEQAMGCKHSLVMQHFQRALEAARDVTPGILTRIMLQYHFFSQKQHVNVDACMSPFVAEIFPPGSGRDSVYLPHSDVMNASSPANQTLQLRAFPRNMKKIPDLSALSPKDLFEIFPLVRREEAGVVFITGSGISKAAGLPTRQDLWKKFSRSDAVSAAGVQSNPEYMWQVIREMYASVMERSESMLKQDQPTAAHRAISNLARLLPVSAIITQNVDGLHQLARGHLILRRVAPPVLELHGTMSRLVCSSCGQRHPNNYSALDALRNSSLPRCLHCDGVYVPDVVFFGERVNSSVFAECVKWINSADLVIVAGTALDVAPAATLLAAANGKVIDFNPVEPRSGLVDYWIKGDAEITLPQFTRKVLEVAYV